jgi:hypothetical protein
VRVHARLGPETRKQFEFLLEATGQGVSDVLKASVAHYYAAVRAGRKPRLTHLRALIGRQGSGRSDVASRSKVLLAEGFGLKAGRTRGSPAR